MVIRNKRDLASLRDVHFMFDGGHERRHDDSGNEIQVNEMIFYLPMADTAGEISLQIV
jgi:hypothetical protein